MKPNCSGCKYELEEAYVYQKAGYFLATSIGREIDEKEHILILIVDNKGNIRVS